MSIRTTRKTIVFRHPFVLRGIERTLTPGAYPVIIDDELMEDLSFPVYRRVSTMILVPTLANSGASIEMVTVDAAALKDAMDRDNMAERASDSPVSRPAASS